MLKYLNEELSGVHKRVKIFCGRSKIKLKRSEKTILILNKKNKDKHY